eukprot:gene7287-8677_t
MLELGRGHADADGTPFKVYDGYFEKCPTIWLTWEDHKELVRLTVEEGIDPMRTGRYKAGPPLERLPYFNPMNGYALLFMHLMCYGIIKKFVNMLRHKYTDARDTCYFSEAQRSQLQANGKDLACPQDMHRGYLDVVQYAGNYTMEDFLNFILIFSPMGIMDVLHSLNSEQDSAWWKLRRAVIYFVRGPLVSTGDIAARRDARKAAAADMWDVASWR